MENQVEKKELTEEEKIKKQKEAQALRNKKYKQTEKGKAAQRRANKKFYEKHKKTGKPRGRPKKTDKV